MRSLMLVVAAVFIGLAGAGCVEKACTIDGECRAKFGEGWTCDQGEYVCVGPSDGADAGTDAGRDDDDAGTGDAGVDAGTTTCAMTCPSGQRCVDGACACDAVSCPNGCCREGVCGPLSECGTCGNCTWSPGPEMQLARAFPSAVQLDHSSILVAGGMLAPSKRIADVTARAEVLDLALGTSAEVSPMNEPRAHHLLVNLGGTILACGGYRKNTDGDFQALQSCERFEPTTRAWSDAAPMLFARSGAAFTVMVDGYRLFVAGGTSDQGSTATAEIFDVRTGRWDQVASMGHARTLATAIRLSGGRIAVVGGADASAGMEIYDPVADQWTSSGPMISNRYRGAAARGSAGIVFSGGAQSVDTPFTTAISSSEVLDGLNQWRLLGDMSSPRMDHTLVRLRNQRMLAIGGHDSARPVRHVHASTEMLEFSGVWELRSTLTLGRSHHATEVLPDGRVVVLGGAGDEFTATASTDILH